jgi:hypothetical protein
VELPALDHVRHREGAPIPYSLKLISNLSRRPRSAVPARRQASAPGW